MFRNPSESSGAEKPKWRDQQLSGRRRGNLPQGVRAAGWGRRQTAGVGPGGHRCSVGGELEAQLGSTRMSANPSRADPKPAEDSSAHSRRGTGHGDLDLTQLHSLHWRSPQGKQRAGWGWAWPPPEANIPQVSLYSSFKTNFPAHKKFTRNTKKWVNMTRTHEREDSMEEDPDVGSIRGSR